MEKSKVTQTKKAHINRFAVIELIMVGAEDDDGRSWIVREDQIPLFNMCDFRLLNSSTRGKIYVGANPKTKKTYSNV